MIYLLEVSACLIVFYAFYYLCLRHKQFHQWNRMYLLSSLGFSFMIPALSIPFYEVKVSLPNKSFASVNNKDINVTNIPLDQGIDFMAVLSTIYLFVSLFFLIKLIIEISSIIKIINSSPTYRKQFVTEVYVGDKLPLSSFFRYLLIPDPDKLTSFEYQHELAHIKQHHSIDKLLVGICNAVLWFNPIVYLMRKNFNELHEYLADQEVINQNNKTVYLNFLRNTVTKQYGFSTLNPFYSLLENRLAMIDSTIKSCKLIFLIAPTLCFFLLGLFSCEEYVTTQSTSTQYSSEADFINSQNPVVFATTNGGITSFLTILDKTGILSYDSNCKCTGFDLVYLRKGKDIQRIVNSGSVFNEASTKLLFNAKREDKFMLDEIKFNCDEPNSSGKRQLIFSVKDAPSNISGRLSIYNKFGKLIIDKADYYGSIPQVFEAHAFILHKDTYAYVLYNLAQDVIDQSTYSFEPNFDMDKFEKEEIIDGELFIASGTNLKSLKLVNQITDFGVFENKKVKSFEFVVKDDQTSKIYNDGPEFNNEVVSKINKLPAETEVKFINIVFAENVDTPRYNFLLIIR